MPVCVCNLVNRTELRGRFSPDFLIPLLSHQFFFEIIAVTQFGFPHNLVILGDQRDTVDIVSQRLKNSSAVRPPDKKLSPGTSAFQKNQTAPAAHQVNYHVIGENLYFINHTVNLLGRLQHLECFCSSKTFSSPV